MTDEDPMIYFRVLAALYGVPDDLEMEPSHPLRILPRVGAAALREGGTPPSLLQFLDEHRGHTVIRMETPVHGGPVAAFDGPARLTWMPLAGRATLAWWPGREVSTDRAFAATRWNDALVTISGMDVLSVWMCLENFTLCHPDNPWCDYSEEQVSPWSLDQGPYETICVVHHGKIL